MSRGNLRIEGELTDAFLPNRFAPLHIEGDSNTTLLSKRGLHLTMTSSPPPSLSDRLLALRKLATDHFLEEDWLTLASQTSTEEIINGHNPPLGKMNWGGDAYDAIVLQVLEQVAARDLNHVTVFETYAANCVRQSGSSPFSRVSLLRQNRSTAE